MQTALFAIALLMTTAPAGWRVERLNESGEAERVAVGWTQDAGRWSAELPSGAYRLEFANAPGALRHRFEKLHVTVVDSAAVNTGQAESLGKATSFGGTAVFSLPAAKQARIITVTTLEIADRADLTGDGYIDQADSDLAADLIDAIDPGPVEPCVVVDVVAAYSEAGYALNEALTQVATRDPCCEVVIAALDVEDDGDLDADDLRAVVEFAASSE